MASDHFALVSIGRRASGERSRTLRRHFEFKMASRTAQGRFGRNGTSKRMDNLHNLNRNTSSKENNVTFSAENLKENLITDLEGNRIVNLKEIINQLYKGCTDCGLELSLTKLLSETKSGLGSYLYIVCTCGVLNTIYTGTRHSDITKKKRRQIFDVNTNTVIGKNQ